MYSWHSEYRTPSAFSTSLGSEWAWRSAPHVRRVHIKMGAKYAYLLRSFQIHHIAEFVDELNLAKNTFRVATYTNLVPRNYVPPLDSVPRLDILNARVLKCDTPGPTTRKDGVGVTKTPGPDGGGSSDGLGTSEAGHAQSFSRTSGCARVVEQITHGGVYEGCSRAGLLYDVLTRRVSRYYYADISRLPHIQALVNLAATTVSTHPNTYFKSSSLGVNGYTTKNTTSNTLHRIHLPYCHGNSRLMHQTKS